MKKSKFFHENRVIDTNQGFFISPILSHGKIRLTASRINISLLLEVINPFDLEYVLFNGGIG